MNEPENRSLLGNKLKLLAGRLYQEGDDGVLRLCLEPSVMNFLQQAHQSSIAIHLAGQQTTQALLILGVYWPSMHQDAFPFV